LIRHALTQKILGLGLGAAMGGPANPIEVSSRDVDGCHESPMASVIIPCKGRLHHLRRTLPTVLHQQFPFPFEVVVVDYDCPDGTFDWCKSLDIRKLLAVRVLNDSVEFHRSRSRNCGASVAVGNILAFVDADMLLDPSWLDVATASLRAAKADFSLVADDWSKGWDRGGTWTALSTLFHSIRGYDERLQGWGSEDSDVQARCRAVGRVAKFSRSLLTPIKHGHDERVRFHHSKSIGSSDRENRDYLAHRSGSVNPDGYGIGQFELFRGKGVKAPPLSWAPQRRIVRALRRPRAVAS
jgi:glycosyltransferase involved in cell wall biosynthesis